MTGAPPPRSRMVWRKECVEVSPNRSDLDANHLVGEAVKRRPDKDLAVFDRNFGYVNDHCNRLVGIRIEEVNEYCIHSLTA